MDIWFLSHTADIRGGGERCLIELVGYLRAHTDHRITVVSPDGPLVEELDQIGGVRHRKLSFVLLRRTSNPLLLLSFALQYLRSSAGLLRLLRAEQPSVLHANSAPAALYGSIVARALGVPMIWHMRDIQPRAPWFRATLPFIGRSATTVIAITGAVRQNLMSFGVPPEKITVVYDAVNPVRTHGGAEFRRQWEISSDERVIGVVGQILHRKGQLTAVRAFARIASEFPKARLLICGGNGESEYGRLVLDEVRSLCLEDRVVFSGFQRDPGPAFDALDVLLLSSNQEPFGRVVAEAMFAGKPVVATRVGGVPELIRDGEDGILVEPGDPESMAEGLRSVLGRPDRIPVMVANARSRAERDFGWEGRRKAIRSVYERLSPVYG